MKQKRSTHFMSTIPSSEAPLICISQDYYGNDESDSEDIYDVLPLPASKFRYSKWSQLDETEITACMLKTPRVRKAPKGFKTDTIIMLQEQEHLLLADDDDNLVDINIPKKSRWKRAKKKKYQNKLENWEQCDCVNLSYQDLGHPYQMKELLKVLRRLFRAETIELIDNSITDLSSVYFGKCKCIYLQRNLLSNLKKLPRFRCIEHISLQQNNITDLSGLELLKESTLSSLILMDNPVALQPGYRSRVFSLLPNLVLLDGLPQMDTDLPVPKASSRWCCIF